MHSETIPHIPGYQLLRLLGKGACGEVWMACEEGDLGNESLCAVRVVRKVDYSCKRNFHRSYEILRGFEPISQRYSILRSIHKIGCEEKAGYYWSVVDLGDDAAGGEIRDSPHYRPRTLETEIIRNGPFPAEKCLALGRKLAGALASIHSHGLTHERIKPANILYSNGNPQLGDMGCRATSACSGGGPEFTPPEGTGDPRADVYSMGLLLCCLLTAQTDLAAFSAQPFSALDEEAAARQDLQRIISKACHEDPASRYADGKALLNAFTEKTHSHAHFSLRPLLLGALLPLIALGAFFLWKSSTRNNKQVIAKKDFAEFSGESVGAFPAGSLLIEADKKADIFIDGAPAGKTPLLLQNVPTGELGLTLKINEEEHKYWGLVKEGKTIKAHISLSAYHPQPNREWRNSLGRKFLPAGDRHIAYLPTLEEDFKEYLDKTNRGKTTSYQRTAVKTLENFQTFEEFEAGKMAVLVESEDALKFANWLTKKEKKEDRLAQNDYYGVEFLKVFEPAEGINGRAFNLFIEKRRFGEVYINTSPREVKIYLHGEYMGRTPKLLHNVPEGKAYFRLSKHGYKDLTFETNILPSNSGERKRQTTIDKTLERGKGVIFGETSWANSLGIRLIALPQNQEVMVSAHETSIAQYNAFCLASGRTLHPAMRKKAKTAPSHPAGYIDRYDAQEFCKWLTAKEREEKLITSDLAYRLPTDREWSEAAGLPLETGKTPSTRQNYSQDPLEGADSTLFSWGNLWPPPAKSCNIADKSTGRFSKYNDGFANTAPVDSFPPNAHGFRNLVGNLWEWVSDPYNKYSPNNSHLGTLRGGSFRNFTKETLYLSHRCAVHPDNGQETFGFRCVLARETPLRISRRGK